MQVPVKERAGNSATIVSPKQHRAPAYIKVFDKRKRPIRGLWVRNGRYYAQLTIEDQVTGIKRVKRVPLEGVTTEAQAVTMETEAVSMTPTRGRRTPSGTSKPAEKQFRGGKTCGNSAARLGK